MVSSGGLFCGFICFKEPYSTQGRKVEEYKFLFFFLFFYRELNAVALPDSKGPKAVQI